MPAHPLTPPDRGALWASLSLTRTQVAALCGLDQRQVGRWTQRGYLPRSPRDPQRYRGVAVDMALLIKQGRQQGLSAYRAAQKARAYLAAENTRQPGLLALDAAGLATVANRVSQADAAVRQVLEVVAPLTPPTNAIH